MHASCSRSASDAEASCPYAIQYSPVHGDWTSEFPVSAPYTCELEPNSHPIRQMHIHDLLEIGYCHVGAGILAVQGRIMTFEPGDVSVVNDREMHMSRCNEGSPSRWEYVWVDAPALLGGVPDALAVAGQGPLGGPGFPNILSHRIHPQTCQLVRDILKEMAGRRAHYRIVVRGLAGALMAHLHRLCPNPNDRDLRLRRTGMERVSPALQHMANHYAQEIDVRHLAELCHLSPTQFRRVFLAATGQPPLTHLAQVRVRMAAAILREHPDKPITTVACDVGFEAQNTFNRQFRDALGMSPSQWRQQG